MTLLTLSVAAAEKLGVLLDTDMFAGTTVISLRVQFNSAEKPLHKRKPKNDGRKAHEQ
jgi:hypothetical protein